MCNPSLIVCEQVSYIRITQTRTWFISHSIICLNTDTNHVVYLNFQWLWHAVQHTDWCVSLTQVMEYECVTKSSVCFANMTAYMLSENINSCVNLWSMSVIQSWKSNTLTLCQKCDSRRIFPLEHCQIRCNCICKPYGTIFCSIWLTSNEQFSITTIWKDKSRKNAYPQVSSF